MPKRGIIRSKRGCFSCRMRKKKCDEVRPICTNCGRNFLPCQWPEFANQTLRGFQEIDVDRRRREIENLVVLAPQIQNTLAYLKQQNEREEHQEKFITTNPNWNLLRDKLDDDMFLKVFFDTVLTTITPPQSIAQVADITKEGLQYSSTRKIAICLGAAFIHKEYDADFSIVDKKYLEAISELVRTMSDPEFDPFHDELLHSILLLVVCESMVGFGLKGLQKHFLPAFAIILGRLENEAEHLKENLKFKLFIDSILYHFSSNIFGYPTETLLSLVDPFEMEKKLQDIYLDCENQGPWSHHPILGLSATSFLTSLKASFLLKFPNYKHNFRESVKLLAYTQETTELSLNYKNEYDVLSRLIDLASSILLVKIIKPQVEIWDPEIQRYALKFMEVLTIYKDNILIKLTGNWAVFVTSLCLVEENQKAFIRQWLTSAVYKSREYMKKVILDTLEEIWEKALGMEILCDLDVMENVYFA